MLYELPARLSFDVEVLIMHSEGERKRKIGGERGRGEGEKGQEEGLKEKQSDSYRKWVRQKLR